MTIRRGKALVVDDDPAVQQLLSRLLDQALFFCFAAANGPQALEEASREQFDVVLLDVGLPGMSGVEVLQRLRVSQPDACFLMVAGMADVATAVEAMRLGAYDYITKPFGPRELLERLEHALQRRNVALQKRDREKALQAKIDEQKEEIREYVTQTVQALVHEHLLEQEQSGARASQRPGVSPRELFSRFLRQRQQARKPPPNP